MCGIAGVIDLSGRRTVPTSAVRSMAQAIIHRGPDEEGFLDRPRLSLASRRLSIVGLADGRQPISNEDGRISVVFNGELFDYPEVRAELEKRGHRLRTHTDTEIIPHRWEDEQEAMLPRLRGQFAFCLYDENRQCLILARDRFGICPVFWTRQTGPEGDWFLFASEIKGLLASGLVDIRPDPHGINHLFTYFAMPGPTTCFEGIEALLPGHYLRIDLSGDTPRISDHTYWEMDFPPEGEEKDPPAHQLVDEFQNLLMEAVDKRLRADVPVVSYLSGGLDSTTVAALAREVRGKSVPVFTIRIPHPKLDEVNEATLAARHLGTEPIVVHCGPQEVMNAYPRLIQAAESPVIDTSCTGLMLLARQVHQMGYKVALTGEGSDEWLAGYPWYKVERALGWLDFIPGVSISQWLRRMFVRVSQAKHFSPNRLQAVLDSVGGQNSWLDIYGIMSLSKLRFFHRDLLSVVENVIPYEELRIDPKRISKWNQVNRGLYFGGRIHLPGLLLQAKGDRVAMASSVETRYPFLDEKVFDFLAPLHPHWKLRRLTDKYLLRLVAERWLPRSIAWRGKAMFRAPFDSFHLGNTPPYVEQLLSDEALKKTGYFDIESVRYWRKHYSSLGLLKSGQRLSIEMGLAGVVATQLWHHTFIDNSLADLPGNPSRRASARSSELLKGAV